jgi:hypothetical protein
MNPRRTLFVAVLVAAVVIAVVIGNARDNTRASSAPSGSANTVAAGAPGEAVWFCPGAPPALPADDASVTISNFDAAPADVVVTILADKDRAPPQTLRVEGRSVTTKPRAELGPPGALTIESFDGRVVVEEGFDGPAGVDLSACAQRAGTVWHFAAGTTPRGVEQWLVIQNPFASDAKVDVTLRTGNGVRRPELLQNFDVRHQSRVILPIHDVAVREGRVAVEVDARTGRIVASQTIAYTDDASPSGTATTIGAPAASDQWYFGDGATAAGTTTWLAIANAGPADAKVDVHVTSDDRDASAPTTITVVQDDVVWAQLGGCAATGAASECVPIPGGSQYTVAVRAEGSPIVAQRFVRFTDDALQTGVTTELGTAQPERHWLFSRDRFDNQRGTALAVLNPGGQAADVAITRLRDGHVDEPTRRLTVPPGSRRSVNAVGRDSEATPRALRIDASSPVVVERTIVGVSDVSTSPGIAAG